MDTTRDLLVRLEAEHELSREEWINLIDNRTNEDESYAAARARDVARGIFGDVTGWLHLDPADLGKTKLDVTIPISKVTVASAGLRDHLLRPGKDGGKPDFFGDAPADARFV